MEWTIALVLGLSFYLIVIYNRLVRLRQQVKTAWSDIDVQLKRRHDLIPKLVDAVQQYAGFERATLTTITELRSQSQASDAVEEMSRLESRLDENLKKLVVLAEAYPELQANQSFLDLQRQLSEVENHIQFARRYYNGSVRDLNIRVESIPDLWLAGVFGFYTAPYFQIEADR